MGVSKNRGGKPPKMDGENNGKPYFLVDDLGVPLFLETPKWLSQRGFQVNPTLRPAELIQKNSPNACPKNSG